MAEGRRVHGAQAGILLRLVVVFAGLGMAWLALLHAPRLVGGAVLAILALAGVLSVRDYARGVRWPSLRDRVALVRRIRRSFAAPPIALALYGACSAMMMLATLLMLLQPSPWVITACGIACVTLLALAAFFDWRARLAYLLRFRSIRRFVRLAFAFLATATVFLAGVLVKRAVSELTRVDPAAFPDFVWLAGVIVYPFALLLVLAAALAAYMLAQYVVVMTAFFFDMVLRWVGGIFIFPQTRLKLADLRYRLVNGRRRPRHYPWWRRATDGIQYLLRPAGTAVMLLAICLAADGAASLSEPLFTRSLAGRLLVEVEYRPSHACEEVQAGARVAYLGDGYVSVATWRGDGYEFSVGKCHHTDASS